MTTKLNIGINYIRTRVPEKPTIGYNVELIHKQSRTSQTFECVDLSPTKAYVTLTFELTAPKVGEYTYTIIATDNTFIRKGIAFYREMAESQTAFDETKTNIIYERDE
jgi:hypothetical protein